MTYLNMSAAVSYKELLGGCILQLLLPPAQSAAQLLYCLAPLHLLLLPGPAGSSPWTVLTDEIKRKLIEKASQLTAL